MRKAEKFYKRITAIGLGALAFVSALFCLAPLFKKSAQLQAEPIEASADESFTRKSRMDDNFEFEQGAAVYKATDGYYEPLHALKFTVLLKNTELETFFDEQKDYAINLFTLYREDDKGQTPIYRAVSVTYKAPEGIIIAWGHKRLGYDAGVNTSEGLSQGGIYFAPDQLVGDEVYTQINYKETGRGMAAASIGADLLGYSNETDFFWDATVLRYSENVDTNFLYGEENGYPAVAFTLGVESPTCSYFVGFDYYYMDYKETKTTGALWWKETQDVCTLVEEGTIHSDTRSVAEVLTKMKDTGVLETQIPDETVRVQAEDIIINNAKKEVTVRYLEAIKDTPFAQVVEQTVNVPVFTGNKLYLGDVRAAVGKSLNCIGSNVKEFVYNEDEEVYQAIYLNSVWLVAATADGKTKDYYLDLNRSYKDYYQGLVDNGILAQGGYEVMLNAIKNKFPAAAAIRAEDLHGYFGYVAIPATETFNSLWKDVFNRPDEFKGTIDEVSFTSTLKYSSYTSLLDDYGYTWMQKAWQTIIDAVGSVGGDPAWEATHYIFYADAHVREAVISQNGTTDIEHIEESLMENDTAEAVDKVISWGANTINDTKSWFGEMQDELRTIYLVLIGCTLAAGLTVGIVFVVKKLRLNEPAKKPRKKKKAGGKKQKK